MIHAVKFTVEGTFPFPVDMLRYDRCYPADSESAINITYSNNHESGGLQVTLIARVESKQWKPTEGRWQSFGWKVVEYHPVY